MTAVNLYSRYKSGIKIYKESGLSIVKNIEYLVAHFTYTDDVVELQRIINSVIQNNANIKYLFILNPENNVVVHSFEDNFPVNLLNINNIPIQNIILLDTSEQDIYDFSYPINEGNLGIIRLGISRERLFHQIRKELVTQLFILLGFLALGVFLAYLSSRKLSKPIIKLVEHTEKISVGDFGTDIHINSKDEIGILADSFNQMCTSLKSLTGELTRKIVELNDKNAEYEMLYEEYSNQNEELSVNLEEIQFINKELQKSKQKAEESDKLKTAFLANISHEIRTPMNGIMGFADLLKSPDLTTKQLERYVDIIEKSGKRMLNIIHNLIDISMIESNQADIHLEPYPLNTLIEDLFAFFKPQTDIKRIQLNRKKELPDKKSVIFIDKNKVTQVLSNLINNAIKFTDSGRITFGYEVLRSKIKFYVHDTGVGIKADMLENIFKRFEQADYNYSKGYDGSGLGLSISKAFIEMHGGEIWADSHPGEGSSFYFTIPHESVVIKKMFRPDLEEKEQIYHEENLPKGLKVLIAEDDQTSYFFLEEIFVDLKYDILLAKTGLEAIRIFKETQDIDLILMDIKMPEMDGIEACRRIKNLNPNVPVFMQSAYTQPADKQKAIQAGCDEYITKPIMKKNLISLISKYALTSLGSNF
jgi:signal transduction histidine kinase/CheY-like chemotaxis protein